MIGKLNSADFAVLGGKPLFERPRSTSSLYRPDIEKFLEYSKVFYEARQFTNRGPLVQELERRLAEFHGTRHCVSFCSGFWALVLTIRCLALPGRTEIVMPSLTYRRMADVAAWAGLTPHFCDVDAQSMALSPETVRPHLNDKTALIMAVHPIVNCCDASGLEALSAETGVPLMFDAVESVYEYLDGRKVGSFGIAECFSMHASKLLNGFEGGYVTTNDPELANRLMLMRGFGFSGQDNVEELGLNAKLNEVHAAMALAALDELEVLVGDNRARYRSYQVGLKEISGIRLVEFDEAEQSGYKIILVELLDDWPLSREQTLKLLNAENILARAYYAPPLHRKRTEYETISGTLPVTESLAERFMLLPCGHLVSEDDINRISLLLRFVQENATDLRGRLDRELP